MKHPRPIDRARRFAAERLEWYRGGYRVMKHLLLAVWLALCMGQGAAAAPRPPTSGDVIAEVQRHINRYCAAHPGMPCSVYQSEALPCESYALGSVGTFRAVAALKFDQGLSTAQAARIASASTPHTAELADYAGYFIDQTKMTKAGYQAHSEVAWAFARVVAIICVQAQTSE